MAKGIHTVVNGESRKGKKAFTVVDGMIHKVKKIFVVKDGIYKQCWQNSIPAGEAVITTSGTWEVPEGVKKIDIFAVGGGGGAGGRYLLSIFNHSPDYSYTQIMSIENYGCNGGYGYTNTLLNCNVTPGEALSIVIGAGGTSGESFLTTAENGNVTYTSGTRTTKGGNGGTTSVLRDGGTLVSASGGNGGNAATSDSVKEYQYGYVGASGGSGSGVSRRQFSLRDSLVDESYHVGRGADGYDGSNGESGTLSAYDSANKKYIIRDTPTSSGGTGQGFTTRKFKEASNTLYASRTVTAPNTGSNGRHQGITTDDWKNDADNGGTGGSGVVIIRWAEQEG